MMTPPRSLRYAALLLTLALSACTQFPELKDTTSPEIRRAAYPDLVPAEQLTAQVQSARITDQTTAGLSARVAALRARAARLRGTVIDRTSRNRLAQKITIDIPQ